MDPPKIQLKTSWDDIIGTLEEFLDTIGGAQLRSTELLAVHLDCFIERINHVQSLILKVSQKRAQVTELLGRRGVSPDRLDALLADLANDLITVKGILGDDKWGDDDAFRKHKRLASVVQGVISKRLGRGTQVN
jgi:hypothetical protein